MSVATAVPGLSILLPSRGRTEQLARSVNSLIDLAQEPEDIQWCFGFDNDDSESFAYFQTYVLPKIQESGAKYTCLGFEPMGYARLHEYVNQLAHTSTGKWMVFWNDDAIMRTANWDTTIKSQGDRFCLQAFETHNKHPYSIFPIVPRKWLELIGHFSQHQLNDAWVSQVAWLLDIMVKIDVHVDHERYDLTGKNDDATFRKRIVFEGKPSDPRDFNYVPRRQQRLTEAQTIGNYLISQGYDMSYWTSVAQGKQPPWERMIAADVNKHLSAPSM